MKALARGLAAAALLLQLAACAELGAVGHVPVDDGVAEPRMPLSHSFAMGPVGAEPAAIVPSVRLPELTAADDTSAADEDSLHGPVSWYGKRFAGRRTANGEIFDPSKLTMAHRELPFGTHVRVTNPANGTSVVVRVNDRGPFVGNRVADVSHAAAKKLGMVKAGVIAAELEVLDDAELADATAGGSTSPAANAAP
jgi:rare lipoprotein A